MKTTLLFVVMFILCRDLKGQSIDSFTNSNEYTAVDTLEIVSSFHDSTDCGEFGGHKEVLKIFKNDKVTFTYHREPRQCLMRNPSPFPNNIVMNYTWSLDIDKQKLINGYLKQLQDHIPSKNVVTNAPSFYWVRFNGREIFRLNDSDASWKEYENFRDAVLKK